MTTYIYFARTLLKNKALNYALYLLTSISVKFTHEVQKKLKEILCWLESSCHRKNLFSYFTLFWPIKGSTYPKKGVQCLNFRSLTRPSSKFFVLVKDHHFIEHLYDHFTFLTKKYSTTYLLLLVSNSHTKSRKKRKEIHL